MELNKIYNMDCLGGMKEIPDGSIDKWTKTHDKWIKP